MNGHPITKEEAINGDIYVKDAYMSSLLFSHAKAHKALSMTRFLMTPKNDARIILLVGPTGAGKTTLATTLVKKLNTEHAIEIAENPALIPASIASVPAGDGKTFNWNLFYQHWLRSMGDVSSLSHSAGMAAEFRYSGSPAAGLRMLRLRFEETLIFRGIRYFFLDEAAHFLKGKLDALEYGDLLKSWSNNSNMKVVLVGAYGSEKLIDASGQMGRRIRVVHFPRYLNTPEDTKAYGQFVYSLQQHLPFDRDIDLTPYVPLLMEACIGLAGETAAALAESIRLATYSEQPWSEEFLFQALPAPGNRDSILLETIKGEEGIKKYLPNVGRPNYSSSIALAAT